MSLNDRIVGQSFSSSTIGLSKPRYTLTDLREDDEFVETSERYLKSLGEGETVDDMFQYFRGANFNLADTHKVFRQSKEFTDQQKKDYSYLKNKFDNSEVGGFKEKAQLGIDATQEIFTDPVTLTSAFFIPWTGGTSVAGRIALGEAAKAGIKASVAREFVKKVPGQVISKPLTTKQIAGIASTEGMAYTGTWDYITQSTEIQTEEREERDPSQTAQMATIGAVLPPAVIKGGQLISKIPSKIRRIQEDRLAQIDYNEGYKQFDLFREEVYREKPTLIDKAKDTLWFRTTQFPLPAKATTPLKRKTKDSELLKEVLKLFRYDADEGFIAPKLGTQEKLERSYLEQLGEFVGGKPEVIKKIFRDNKLYSLNRKEIPLPFSEGSWINPLRSTTVRPRKSFKYSQSLNDETNNELTYYLRSGKTTIIKDGVRKNISPDIINAGDEIKVLLKDTIERANEVGIKTGKVKYFFPRRWNTTVIANNRDEFIDLVQKGEQIDYDAAREVWKELSEVNSPASSSASAFNSSLKASRLLTKIDDSKFGKFLDNDVQNVLTNYFEDAGKIIVRTDLFGETEDDFVKRWITPIQKELGSDRKLNDYEKNYLKDLYNYTTGLKGQIDTQGSLSKWLGAKAHDVATVTMQASLLMFSTVTSLSEIGVNILKNAPYRKGIDSLKNGMADASSEWWKTQKNNYLPYLDEKYGETFFTRKGLKREYNVDPNIDVRSEARQDLNSFFVSLNMAKEDRAAAIYGQAVGKVATKAQNLFFKTVGLHQWTRFVQLVGYDMGKSIIYRNLKAIDDFNSKLIPNTNKNKLNMLRRQDELSELNIDVEKGLEWIKKGSNSTDDFYINNVRQGAVRYTNEVVMNPTAASAQKPLLHSRAPTKWIFGLMGFPTAFSNTALRNVAKGISRDMRLIRHGTSSGNISSAIIGGMFMTSVGMLNHTFRTGGKNLDKYERGELTATDLVLKGLSYSGLMGPGEMYFRYSQSKKYETKIAAALGSVVGPNLPDVIDYMYAALYRGALAETVLKRAPFASGLKSLYPETWEEALKKAREIDKESLIGREKQEEKVRQLRFKGGEVSKENPVPNVAPEPSERINPYTGEPYEAEMERLGFKDGLLVSIGVAPVSEKQIDKLKKGLKKRKAMREGGDVETQESFSNQILKTIQQNRNWSDEETAILNSFANLVGYAESDNQADRLQDSGGPGRGMYQYEIGESQGASTGRNRFFNFAKDNNINVPEEYLGLLGEQGPTSVDFSKLPQDLQTAIFYADKAKHPEFSLNDLVSGKLSFEDAWADYHWAGDPTEREAKVDYFLRKNNLIK